MNLQLKRATVTKEINIDQEILLDIMSKLSGKIITEFMFEYDVDETEARKSVAEMYYINQYV